MSRDADRWEKRLLSSDRPNANKPASEIFG